MAEYFPIDVNGTGNYYGNFYGNLTGTASYAISASWAPGGGGGTPGGLNTYIQYNNGGSFGGVPVLTYDGTILRATGSFSGSLVGTASWANNVISASFASTASYLLGSVTSASYATTASYINPLVQNVIITGSIYIPDSTNSIYFSGSGAASRLVWNDTDGTLDLGLKGGNVTLQIGQEEVIRVVNKTGADLLESQYRAVRVRNVSEGGAQGQRLAIVLAQANNDTNSATTLGLVTEDITNNQEGFITTFGLVRNIDTTGTLQGETWVDGDMLYLSPTTSGSITNVKPQAPQHTVILGYVVYAHNNNGKIFVKVDNGYELDELHNVKITTASLSSGDLLVYSSSVWVNTKQLTGSYGLTGSLQATSFTGSLLGTSSWANNTISASYATQANNAAVIDIYSFSSPVESYLLMSNVIATTGVAVGGDTDLRYNASTNVLTVPNISATTLTGSLLGTSSWATRAISASFLPVGTYNITSSWAQSASNAIAALSALSADNAKAITTIANSTNADFYPTFVDSNNSPTAASEIVYTSNRITFNPSTQLLSAPRIFSTTVTASAFTGSLTGSLLGTASYATQALSASWAPSVASNPFPYTGSAIISGSLTITGSLQVGVSGTNSPTIDSTVGTLGRGIQTKVDWVNGYLNNSSGVNTVDWESAILYDASTVGSVDWGSRLLNNTSGVTTLDWENSTLYDASTFPSMDWQSRFLFDSAGNRSYNYDARALIYPNGTTTAINYSTQDKIAMTGSVSITGSLTVSGSSTFTNIGPAVFTGSVSSLNGFTGSLQGTASWATNALTASLLLGSVTSASYAATASSVTIANDADTRLITANGNGTLNGEGNLTFDGTSLSLSGNALVTSRLTVGSSSLGSGENTLVLGLPPNGGTGEGGQLLLQASGGLYTSASMLDNYQNKFRVLRGTNASSDAYKLQLDMHTGQIQIPNYNSPTALIGSEVAALGVDTSGNVLTTTVPGAILTNNYIGAGFANPIITYMPFGATTVSGTESQRQVASPVAGVIKNFFIRTNNTSPAGSTTTFTVRVNGVATNVKITIGGSLAAAKFSDTTNSASVAIGDDISLQVSTSAANSPQINQYSLGIYPS
jgi:hypothetical protein